MGGGKFSFSVAKGEVVVANGDEVEMEEGDILRAPMALVMLDGVVVSDAVLMLRAPAPFVALAGVVLVLSDPGPTTTPDLLAASINAAA